MVDPLDSETVLVADLVFHPCHCGRARVVRGIPCSLAVCRMAIPFSFMVLIAAIIDSSVHCLRFFRYRALSRERSGGGNRGVPGPFFFFRTKLGAIV